MPHHWQFLESGVIISLLLGAKFRRGLSMASQHLCAYVASCWKFAAVCWNFGIQARSARIVQAVCGWPPSTDDGLLQLCSLWMASCNCDGLLQLCRQSVNGLLQLCRQSVDGLTALMMASWWGFAAVVHLLLRNPGTDVNAANEVRI